MPSARREEPRWPAGGAIELASGGAGGTVNAGHGVCPSGAVNAGHDVSPDDAVSAECAPAEKNGAKELVFLGWCTLDVNAARNAARLSPASYPKRSNAELKSSVQRLSQLDISRKHEQLIEPKPSAHL